MPVPVAAEQLFVRALSRNPENRPATATQFIAELARAAHAPAEMLETGWMWRSPAPMPARPREASSSPCEPARAPMAPTIEDRPRRDREARLVSSLRLTGGAPAAPTPAAFTAGPSTAPAATPSRLALSLAIAAPFALGLALLGAVALAYALAAFLPIDLGVHAAPLEPARSATAPARSD
jgi:hypothetical protein